MTAPAAVSGLRGRLTRDRPLAELSWLRVGGPADLFFQPADPIDLSQFLRALDPKTPVFPMGVGSNLIIRDGGIAGAVVRLGRGFNAISVEGDTVRAGAAALSSQVALRAAEAGIDLGFLRTIPGSVGGAVRMNAGCYGSYTADALVSVQTIDRAGKARRLGLAELGLSYRASTLPPDTIVTEAIFTGPRDAPKAIAARMEAALARRAATQPVEDRSAGSTFRNPAGFSSTGAADDVHDLKAWSLIDRAGLRGARQGGAEMSAKHPNFLVNTGDATATELESLGEDVRKKVLDQSGITLEWEIMRVGRPVG